MSIQNTVVLFTILGSLTALSASLDLRVGSQVRSPIARSQTRTHTISLAKDQYLRLLVGQFEIDVSVAIFDSNGLRITRCDTSEWGPEVCSLVAPQGDIYTVEVRALENSPDRGAYSLRITHLRASNSLDRHRVRAQVVLDEIDRATPMQAVALSAEAVTEAKLGGDTFQYARALTARSRALHKSAHLSDALQVETQVNSIWRTLDDSASLAYSLRDLARLRSRLGEIDVSHRLASQAAKLMSFSTDRRLRAAAMNIQANRLVEQGREDSAILMTRRRLALLAQLGDANEFANALQKLSMLLDKGHRYAEALQVSEEYLDRVRGTSDTRALAAAEGRLADVLVRLRRFGEAVPHYQKVIAIHRLFGDLNAECDAHGALAVAYLGLGDPNRSLQEVEWAQRLALSTEERDASPKWRAALFRRQSGALSNIRVHTLLMMNRVAEAFLEFDHLKAWPLQTGRASPAEIAATLLDRDTVLVEFFLEKDDINPIAWVVTGEGNIQLRKLGERGEIIRLIGLCRHAMAERGRHVQGESPEQHRARVSSADSAFQRASNNLSRLILTPLADDIRGKRLLIVPDLDFNGLPFAALPDPDRPSQTLLRSHEIAVLPSASGIVLLEKERAQRTPAANLLGVVADPVFHSADRRFQAQAESVRAFPALDGRLGDATRAVGVRSALPSRLIHSRREALAISGLVPQARLFLDYDASRRSLLGGALSQYRVLHFATHGFSNPSDPDLSGLLLSRVGKNGQPQAGFVNFTDIYNLPIKADLVVLSACQTGVGRDFGVGGYLSLSTAFLHAGARRAVSSLWTIDDEATAALMTRFYREHLQNKLSASAALRKAQLEIANDPLWRSPYYWAGFMFQGQWKN